MLNAKPVNVTRHFPSLAISHLHTSNGRIQADEAVINILVEVEEILFMDKFTMEVTESSDAMEAMGSNEFDLESFKLGEDDVFPKDIQNEDLGKKSFLIVMSTMPVEFHRLTSSSMLGKTFPRVWIRGYNTSEDESPAKSTEYVFDSARPVSFQLKAGPFGGSSGYVTFVYQKAEVVE